jgi:hypothetical protein
LAQLTPSRFNAVTAQPVRPTHQSETPPKPLGTLLTLRTGISDEISFVCEKEVTETYRRGYSRTDSKGVTLDPMGLCQPYGCETHMLMVAEIVIGDHFCTSLAYVVLRAKYWVVGWARPTTLTEISLQASLRGTLDL